jgi:hypothetical protein
MPKVVLQFWVSLDGYSCDPGTELYQIMEEISDDEHEKYFVAADPERTGKATA